MPELISQSSCSAEEWNGRVELSLLYRLFAFYGWTALTHSHLSARVAGEPDRFLINPYGLTFDEITPSNLAKVDFEGRIVAGPSPVNEAGKVFHATFLRARPEINFVLHSHTRAGVAVSTMKCGLLPISQWAGIVLGTLSYHRYAVIEDTNSLIHDLGENYAMILHNHGLFTCGRTAAEAFFYHSFLQRACEAQIDALHSGQESIFLPDDVLARLSAWGAPGDQPGGDTDWKAEVRQLERRTGPLGQAVDNVEATALGNQ
jgi:ribulose-5-phosphate 4-epimerase/fuculose-1-phosphate aldolase